MKDRAAEVPAVAESISSAREAGLAYVTDARPGIRRRRGGAGFRYLDAEGRPVSDPGILARIRSLAIPPAWADVWICPSPHGHLQATGRDARGRKQYRYHPRWRSVRDENKFDRVVDFARALPAIRRKVATDLRLPDLPREKVLAAVVRLLETTFIRIGNQRYAKENGSYGLTTLRNRHVKVQGERIALDFRGKSGRQHHIELEDARLARVIRRCRDLPGYELFRYVDGSGEPRSIGSADVNAYLKAISGEDYTAKDFRTWAGTVLATLALRACEPPRSQAHARRMVNNAITAVAHHLGNTVTVCRKCYIHPRVVETYMEGLGGTGASRLLEDAGLVPSAGRRRVENAVIRLLTGRMRRAHAAIDRRAKTGALRSDAGNRGGARDAIPGTPGRAGSASPSRKGRGAASGARPAATPRALIERPRGGAKTPLSLPK